MFSIYLLDPYGPMCRHLSPAVHKTMVMSKAGPQTAGRIFSMFKMQQLVEGFIFSPKMQSALIFIILSSHWWWR